MVVTLQERHRTARKHYRCGMCASRIRPGARYHVQTNVSDGRAYDWRECMPCHRDHVITYCHDWSGGWYEGGVNYDTAYEWAMDAAAWGRTPFTRQVVTVTERLAARAWLARATGGEGE